MKIYLASFFEEHNFGSGRLISVAQGQKPRLVQINLIYEGLCPSQDISRKYYREKQEFGIEVAGKSFQDLYSQQLQSYLDEAKIEAEKQGKTLVELLDLKEGDTLLSWERAGRTNYRNTVASQLKKIGYEVFLEGVKYEEVL